jgi:hypothetical protein
MPQYISDHYVSFFPLLIWLGGGDDPLVIEVHLCWRTVLQRVMEPLVMIEPEVCGYPASISKTDP